MMDPETKKAIDDALAEVARMKSAMIRKDSEKGTKELLDIINKSFIKNLTYLSVELKETVRALKDIAAKGSISKEEILKAIGNLKLEPNITIEAPDLKFPKQDPIKIEIPEIKIPQAKITVSPTSVKIPPVNFPKEMKISGLASFIKMIMAALKRQPQLNLPYTRDKGMPVVIVDKDGKYFKGFGAVGASPRAVSIKKEVPVGFEQLAVLVTATALASIPTKANKAVITVEDKTLRYRDDGSDPTSTVGLKVFIGGIIILNSREALENFRAIRVGTSNSELNVAYYETK